MALRCFIAVEVSEAVRRSVGTAVEELKKSGADVKWVRVESMHITLKFLGSTEEAAVSAITDALQEGLAQFEPFYIRISGLGSFPEGRHPRVVWAGIQDGGALGILQQRIDERMKSLGFPAEGRPFSPHLTVGRVRSGRGMGMLLKKMESGQKEDFGECEIRRVLLMKSELRPAGAEYTMLAEMQLKRRKDDE